MGKIRHIVYNFLISFNSLTSYILSLSSKDIKAELELINIVKFCTVYTVNWLTSAAGHMMCMINLKTIIKKKLSFL